METSSYFEDRLATLDSVAAREERDRRDTQPTLFYGRWVILQLPYLLETRTGRGIEDREPIEAFESNIVRWGA